MKRKTIDRELKISNENDKAELKTTKQKQKNKIGEI